MTGKEYRQIRRALGFRQQSALAAALDISVSTVYRLERSVRVEKVQGLALMALALRREVNELKGRIANALV